MTPAEVVIARLLDIGAVTAWVNTRIYQLLLRQRSDLPAIRVQEIDVDAKHHLRGHVRPLMARVQVDVYVAETSGGDPLDTAHVIADAVHGDGNGPNASGLSGWIGAVGSPPTIVHGVFRQDRADSYEGDEVRLVRTRQDYMIHMT
jgi:hypothetical protein